MCKCRLHGKEVRREDWFDMEDLNWVYTHDLGANTNCWAYFAFQLNQSYQ